MEITGILLAAGSASRFGGGKLAHPLPDGTPIGLASLRNLRAALPDVLVVIREGDARLREMFEDEGARVQECADARLGISRSLACAVRAAPAGRGWLFALGDMPYLKPQTLRAVAGSIGDGIAIPEYAGQRGNPVGFASRYVDELLALRGDEGARSLLRRHPDDVTVVPCDDPGILRDIDRREDLDGASHSVLTTEPLNSRHGGTGNTEEKEKRRKK
ncbi:MAG TPA: nucleotidyltransferase family protein [Burkholderiales bacterium]|nr:nucleotidyltransferase family protein [Burkholderiales bacterium]